MVAMESEKTQMREEFVKKQMERDASCQDEKREIEDLKNKELDEISETLNQSEMTVMYMSKVMLHNNQVMEEQENLLKVQAGAIQELNEEVKAGKNCSTLLGAAADRIALQEETIDLLKVKEAENDKAPGRTHDKTRTGTCSMNALQCGLAFMIF